MSTLTNDQAHHIALVEEAKRNIGIVAPEFRGQLARYLDLGEEPGALLCCFLDADEFATVECGEASLNVAGLFWWLAKFAPVESWGSPQRRRAWQRRVSALVASHVEDSKATRVRAVAESLFRNLGPVSDHVVDAAVAAFVGSMKGAPAHGV